MGFHYNDAILSREKSDLSASATRSWIWHLINL